MAEYNLESTDKKILQNILDLGQDRVWKYGYFLLSSSDFSTVTGGFEATKSVDLFTFTTDPASTPGGSAQFSRRPHFEAYHYTKDGSSGELFDGSYFEINKMPFTIFNDYSTGSVDRFGRAYLDMDYSIPNFTVSLNLTYFTDSSTGQTYSKDGNNWLFWLVYTTNIVGQELSPFQTS